MTDLQRRIAALSPEKRELLEARLAALAAAGGPAPDERIRPRDPSRPTPLGIAQQREWAIERFRSANNMTGALRLEGRLDLPLLSRVLTEILDRHEVLRSTVELPDGRHPVQVVHPGTPVPTPVVDLTHLDPQRQRDEVRRRCRAEVARPFDPADPQRLRITLMRVGEDAHVALFATDHAASDAWSLSIIVQELAALYGKHLGDGRHALPPPEIQFGDFAAWQRARFDEERLAAEVRHWRHTLADIPAGFALPTDRPDPPRPTYAGDVHFTDLSPELTAELRGFSERESASLFMVLLAASAVLLNRYLDQDDLVIGSLVAGRTRVETERLIGCFANPLPLRVRLREDQTLREVVGHAREVMTTALDHQDLPYERLIEELGLGRESSQTSLSRMWINVLTLPDMTLELPGLRITREPMDLGMASVDLTLAAIPRGDHLQLQWHYMTELFDADTVTLLADQFLRVLRRLVTAPDTLVSQVTLAIAGDPADHPARHATMPAAARAAEPGFVELFQRRAAHAPHAPAVVFAGTATSYGMLNRDANRLAHRLRALGVGPDDRVGILVDRSPRLAVAILGVLKAGAAYVPLDPTYPPERIGYLLADADARVLVTEERLAGVPDRGGEIATVLLDGPTPLPDEAEPAADTNPTDPPAPCSLAYVVYTSGSTGRPKGAMIEHRSLVAFARDVVDRLGLGAGDRFLQFASPGFDVLAEELFPTWLAGGAVVIPDKHLINGEDDLVALAERERLTVMELPTAYWHEWVRELDRRGRGLPASLRLVIIGGERVLPERLAMWRRTGVPLAHVYGLTETTVSSTFFQLDPADPVWDRPNLPIGTALPTAELHVLDKRLRPVPAGGTGELYIGGVSLARGYLARPGLTAHRFVADPHPARSGQRLYRTGDVVRQRADGNLEFITRVDTQIKIRGFRVEPTEIESTLTRHPQVAEAVVTLHELAPGDRRLVAYVVPNGGGTPTAADLRRYLEGELPAYMVPASYVELGALPLNANGKVDRGLLPAPDGQRPAAGEDYAAPETAAQRTLAGIVASVVGLDRIGVHDNFFEVGGDSILAIQVVARAQEAGLKLTPYDLFAHPTVASLAEVVAAGSTVDAEQGDVTGPVPLTPPQRSLCTAELPVPQHWNTSVLLTLAAPVEPDLLRTAVDHLVGHHDGLRQRFLLKGERTRTRIAPRGDEPPVEVHDLSDLVEADQEQRLPALIAQLQLGLDLAVGPLLRFALIRVGHGRPDRLAVVAHRLVADTDSMRIVLEDLETAMVQLTAGEEVRFLPKTTSWLSWGRRLGGHATADPVQAQRAYWTELVATRSAALPADAPAEGETEAATRTVSAALDPAATAALLRTGGGSDGVRDLLLAALARTLTDWTGAPRHLVDVERHDREPVFPDVDLSRTVGWFSHPHPVPLTSAPDERPAATLETVAAALRAVPDAGIGWQLLRQGADPLPEPPVELLFDYTGTAVRPASGAFAVAAASAGDNRDPGAPRPYALEVRAEVTDDRLAVTWAYGAGRHQRGTVERLAARHLDELRTLLGPADGTDGSAPRPADFPLARVDQGQLDDLLGRLSSGQAAR